MPLALLPGQVFAPLLVFVRLGTMLMLLPGFGEVYVPQRYRLLLGLLLALMVAPVLAPALPKLPADPAALTALLFAEIVIGAFLGSIARFLLFALDTAGTIISMQLGLSAAQVFNPMMAQQTTLPGAFLMAAGAMVVFATDAHHLMLRAAVDSYAVFAAGQLPPWGELSDAIAHGAASSFRLGVELAAPFLVVGTVFFAAIGVLSKLVPQLHIFFVAMPLQILGGLAVLSLTLAAMMGWFLERFAESATRLLP
ncbi:MAG: flagellar type III secretion system protein FliR [Alphaproteobacteria bacterium]|nr:flagellar type III secretion system protein FliR [Alphaproteobacteria bacterium]